MIVRSTSIRRYRICAVATLFFCLFWNTVGISTHNHDLLGDVTGSILDNSSSSSSRIIGSSQHRLAVAADDMCPGCSFDAASVSGALVALTVPPAPRAVVGTIALRARYRSPDCFGLASRGPPST